MIPIIFLRAIVLFQSSHVCGMAMAAGGLGYDDLNELMKVTIEYQKNALRLKGVIVT